MIGDRFSRPDEDHAATPRLRKIAAKRHDQTWLRGIAPEPMLTFVAPDCQAIPLHVRRMRRASAVSGQSTRLRDKQSDHRKLSTVAASVNREAVVGYGQNWRVC